MKKLLTTVFADAVVDWGLFEGIRELVQNGMDAGDRGFRFDIVYLRDREELLLYNEGASITRPELLVGYTTKRDDTNQRGRHGDGFKMGAVALIRCGKLVQVSNGLCGEVITASIDQNPDYANANVLCFNIERPDILPIDKNKLIIKVSGITPQEVSGIKDKFLQWQGLELGDYYKTDDGKVLLQERYKGKIFSRGIYVCDVKELEYGYDLENLELGRDRNLAREYDIFWETSRIWGKLGETYGKDETVIKMLESNANDVVNIEYFTQKRIKDSSYAKFTSTNGEKSYPCSNEYERREVSSLGYKPVFVSETHRKILEKSLPSIWSLKEKQKLAKADTVDMTKVFRDLLAKGWKIKRYGCECGGNYTWLKPDNDGNFSNHGCICHSTPIDEVF